MPYSDAAPALILRRRQRLEDRPQVFDDIGVATDHHAVAFLQAPHATTGAAIHVVHLLLGQTLRAAHCVLVIGIAAVDHDVTRLQVRQQGIERLIHDLAGGHHQPQHARRLQHGGQFFQRVNRIAALIDQPLARLRHRIETDHAMAAFHQALGHEVAHFAEADHAQFHAVLLV